MVVEAAMAKVDVGEEKQEVEVEEEEKEEVEDDVESFLASLPHDISSW